MKPDWLRKGVASLEATKCRVWEFDSDTGITGHEVPISRYATPNSFTTIQARFGDIWMGCMMWHVEKTHGIKLTGEQARIVMYTYMSSPSYKETVERWKKLKTVTKSKTGLLSKEESDKLKEDERSHNSKQTNITSLKTKVRIPMKRPTEKPLRIAMRKPIRRAIKRPIN